MVGSKRLAIQLPTTWSWEYSASRVTQAGPSTPWSGERFDSGQRGEPRTGTLDRRIALELFGEVVRHVARQIDVIGDAGRAARGLPPRLLLHGQQHRDVDVAPSVVAARVRISACCAAGRASAVVVNWMSAASCCSRASRARGRRKIVRLKEDNAPAVGAADRACWANAAMSYSAAGMLSPLDTVFSPPGAVVDRFGVHRGGRRWAGAGGWWVRAGYSGSMTGTVQVWPAWPGRRAGNGSLADAISADYCGGQRALRRMRHQPGFNSYASPSSWVTTSSAAGSPRSRGGRGWSDSRCR